MVQVGERLGAVYRRTLYHIQPLPPKREEDEWVSFFLFLSFPLTYLNIACEVPLKKKRVELKKRFS